MARYALLEVESVAPGLMGFTHPTSEPLSIRTKAS